MTALPTLRPASVPIRALEYLWCADPYATAGIAGLWLLPLVYAARALWPAVAPDVCP